MVKDNWKIYFSKKAQNDVKKLKSSNLKEKAEKIIDILENNPLQNPPKYKKLTGDLSGCYSRRINHQHRIVYYIDEKDKCVYVTRMFNHY